MNISLSAQWSATGSSSNSDGKSAKVDRSDGISFVGLVCQCNQTLNLLSRSEYFTLETNIANDQLILNNLFTPPHSLTLIRSRETVPTLTFRMSKGPIDLLSIDITNQTTEFLAYITVILPAGLGSTVIGPIRSNQGRINQCYQQVTTIQLELFALPILTSRQNLQLNLNTCEHTLREFLLLLLGSS